MLEGCLMMMIVMLLCYILCILFCKRLRLSNRLTCWQQLFNAWLSPVTWSKWKTKGELTKNTCKTVGSAVGSLFLFAVCSSDDDACLDWFDLPGGSKSVSDFSGENLHSCSICNNITTLLMICDVLDVITFFICVHFPHVHFTHTVSLSCTAN